MNKDNQVFDASQTNAKKQTKGDYLIKRIPLPNTPFIIVGNNEQGFMLTLGQHKLTEYMKTPGQIKKYLEEHHWEITMIICTAVIIDSLNKIHQVSKDQLTSNPITKS